MNDRDATSEKRRGVVAVIPRGSRLLVIRRAQGIAAPGAFCFPGGAIEAGESEDAALCREMEEELGAAIAPVGRLWRSTTAWNVELSWWLAHVAPNCVLAADSLEVASAHWLTVKEILALPELLSSNRDFFDAWQRGEFAIKGLEGE